MLLVAGRTAGSGSWTMVDRETTDGKLDTVANGKVDETDRVITVAGAAATVATMAKRTMAIFILG